MVDNNFERAQAAYDAMEPPELPECPYEDPTGKTVVWKPSDLPCAGHEDEASNEFIAALPQDDPLTYFDDEDFETYSTWWNLDEVAGRVTYWAWDEQIFEVHLVDPLCLRERTLYTIRLPMEDWPGMHVVEGV